MSVEKRRKRKREVAARAATPDPTSTYCRVVGCKNPTRAAAGKGLNRRFCRAHEDHHQRHGSPYRGSYGADWLNPYRRAAFDWLTENAENTWVKNAIAGVQGLYQKAGPAVEAFRLRGLKPEERARAAWARLRKAEIDPRLPLAAWIAIEMIVRDDPQAVTTPEYKRVQGAKIIHRIVSGTHKRWQQQRPDGKIAVIELHKFPLSRGRVLCHIGEDLEHVAEVIVEKYLEDVSRFKKRREKDGKLSKRAHPETISLPKRAKKMPAQQTPVSAQASASEELGLASKRERPYSVKLPDGTVVTYN